MPQVRPKNKTKQNAVIVRLGFKKKKKKKKNRNKKKVCAVFRRYTLDPNIQIGKKLKGLKQIYSANSNHKKTGVAKLIQTKYTLKMSIEI